MTGHNQSVFYVERLHADWLPLTGRRAISACNALVFGLVFGLTSGMAVGPIYGAAPGLVFGLLIGMASGLAFLDENITCVDVVSWSWSGFWISAIVALVGVGTYDILMVVTISLSTGLEAGLHLIPTDDTLRRSVGPVLAGLISGFGFGLLLVVAIRVVTLPAIAMFEALAFYELETRSVPNEGIRRGARNAVIFGLIGMVVGTVSLVVGFSLAGWYAGNPFGWSTLGLVAGLVYGICLAMAAGGASCIKHGILRLWLIQWDLVPWNYVEFLDHAVERILLRKVGGGYAFIHRMLLEHFAARYGTRPTGTTASHVQLEEGLRRLISRKTGGRLPGPPR